MRHVVRDSRGDGGGHAVELLVVATVLLIFVLLLAAFGRASTVGSKVDAAAASAARAASQAYDAASAERAGKAQAAAAILTAGLTCHDWDAARDVTVDTSGFAAAAGEPGAVVVTIACTVDLSDVAAPGIPGSTTMTGRAASPIDLYREGRDRP